MVKLNILMSDPSVVVLTPTTGAASLRRAIQSVNNQTYKGQIRHLVVCDGPEYMQKTVDIIDSTSINNPNITLICLPENVGGNGFYGHRVYAAFPHLVSEDFVFFLDQDASYEPNHVESMVSTILDGRYDWAYSLRNIVDDNGTFLCRDNCESLGKWPAYVGNEDVHLIDTSCFGFRTQFLIQVCQLWHWGWGGDRRFLDIVWKTMGHTNFGTTQQYTLNYALGGNSNSPTSDFFIRGNKIMEEKYNGKFPWHPIPKSE